MQSVYVYYPTPLVCPMLDSATVSEQDLRRFRTNFGMRLGAYLIDYLVMGIVSQIIIAPLMMGMMEDMVGNMMRLGRTQPNSPEAVFGLMGDVFHAFSSVYCIIGLIYCLYYLIMEGMYGITVGKLALGIKIAHQNSVDKGRLMARAIIKSLPFIIMTVGFGLFWATRSLPIMFISFGFMGLSSLFIFIAQLVALGESRQTLYDKMTQTAVYKKTDIGTLHEKLVV